MEGTLMRIGKIERVPLREVWRHEASDFTRWLQENIDVLNDLLDRTLSPPEREKSAGAFSVDLVAEDENGDLVVIENQLSKSDHDHLGKLVTYLTAFEAKAAIWIVAEARPEHVRAVAWLNESTSSSFFLFLLEGVRIGDSDPAPLLTKIVGPSAETRAVGVKKKELSERHQLRHEFWERLLERAKDKTSLHGGVSANTYAWLGTGAGRSGLSYVYWIGQENGRVELYIDQGKGAEDWNQSVLSYLRDRKEQIEQTFGGELEWLNMDGKRSCIVRVPRIEGGYRDEPEQWPKIQDALIDRIVRLERALAPHIRDLPM
jgi:hypothetical protein